MYGYAPIGCFAIGATASGFVTGDSFRLAFRDRLLVWMTDLGIAWPIRDLVNAGDNPDVSRGFVALDFPGGQVDAQYTFGAPGRNFWIEEGQVTVYLKTRLGAGTALRNQAELYGAQLRGRFRGDRFVAGTVTVQITGTAAMGGGQDEGGLWVEAVGLAYRVFNVG